MRIDKKLRQKQERMNQDKKKSRRKKREKKSEESDTLTEDLSDPFVMVLHVHIDHKDYWGRRAQDVHFHFHTAPGL